MKKKIKVLKCKNNLGIAEDVPCQRVLEKVYEKRARLCVYCLANMNPLKVLRLVHGIGQTKMAILLECSQSNISKTEANLLPIGVKELAIIQELFKIDMNLFVHYQTWNQTLKQKIINNIIKRVENEKSNSRKK